MRKQEITYILSLTSISMPKSVTSIRYSTFADYNSLISITIPKGVTSIEYFAFRNCNSLTLITLPKIFESRINEIFEDVELSSIKITYI